MNVPEHVVKLRLETKGCFVMGPIGVGHFEIDILAVKLDPSRTGIETRVHVEVTVSGRPGGPDDGTGLKEYVHKKFDDRVNKRAEEQLGPVYEK